jgi:hypothetical protein
MKMTCFLTALALSLAMPATVQARTKETTALPRANEIVSREVAAPPSSAACMTDHGPSECGEPMWLYGSRSAIGRQRNAF